ncbi:MAG: aminotransferase class IV [Saprospiraceae bacterium]|nr:aminotransferase class IV [Saprospiraceae bacterium]
MSKICAQYFLYNDKILHCEDFDASFITEGISIYEVIRIIKGVPLFVEEHLERLSNSAKISNLELWFDEITLIEKIKQLISINEISEGNIKLVFNYQNKQSKKNFLLFKIHHKYPTSKQISNGVAVALFHAERNNPNAKILNIELSESANILLERKNIYEVILVDKNGFITEGSKSNIFMIKNDEVFTSPVHDVLPGITRQYVIEICRDLGLKISEKRVHESDIKNLDAIFITGTSPKVLPICKVDDVKFTFENIILYKIMLEYNAIIENYILS